MDHGNNATYLGIYERIVALFWVMKNRLGHVLWERMEKEEGDVTPVQCWKEHHAETSGLNRKMDVVLEALGFQLLAPLSGHMGGMSLVRDGDLLRHLVGHCNF